MMNLLRNNEVMFNTPAVFRDRYDGSSDYFTAKDDIEPDPLRGLAMRRSNIIPDICSVSCRSNARLREPRA